MYTMSASFPAPQGTSFSGGPPGEGPKGSGIVFIVFFLLFIGSSFAFMEGASRVSTSIMKGGETYDDVIIGFGPMGGMDPSLSMPVPDGGPVLSSSLKISTVEGEPSPPSVSIDVGMDGRVDWSFGGGPFGALGSQENFISGEGVKRVLQGTDGGTFSFLLPADALIDNSSLVLSTPPLPGPDVNPTSLNIHPGTMGVESLDAGDIDGDGYDEMIFHSAADSTVYLLERDGGTTWSLREMMDGVVLPPVIRILDPSEFRVHGFIIQYTDPSTGTDNVSIIKLTQYSVPEEIHLSGGLARGSVGFQKGSGRVHGSGAILVLGNNSGRVLEYRFNHNGALSRQVVLDMFGPTIGIGGGDLDGNGYGDLVMFPPPDRGNISLIMGGPNGSVTVYPFDEDPTQLTPSGEGTAVDMDGDGREEFFFPARPGNETAVLGVEDGVPFLSSFGPNGSFASPRSVPRESYGDGGAYSGGEALLYLLTSEGDYRVLPVSTPSGDYLVQSLPGIGGPAVIGSIDETGEGLLYWFDKRDGSWVSDISWSYPGSVILSRGGREMVLERVRPDPAAVDLGMLITDHPSGNLTMDGFNNPFVLMEVSSGGDGGLVSFSGLSVDYDVTLDAGLSRGFLEAQIRAQRDFGGETIPFMVTASGGGSVRVGPSVVVHDAPPVFLSDVPRTLEIDEGSLGQTILKISDVVVDDMTDPADLDVDIVPVSEIPPGLLLIGRNNELISHASTYPDLFGTLVFEISVSDGSSSTLSAPITLIIRPVEDPPSVNIPLEDIVMAEGSEYRLRLSGPNGTFTDVDGDTLHFVPRLSYMDPPDMNDFIRMEVSDAELVIRPSVEGRGGRARLEITAYDREGGTLPGVTSVCLLTVTDTDAPPTILSNPGLVVLSEDQDTPTRIQLDGWIHDPDTDIGLFDIIAYSSDPRLKVSVELYGGSPYLFLLPTSDLTGKMTVWIEVKDGNTTLVDRLLIDIEPQNDLPGVSIDDVEYHPGMGYVVSGSVADPDDRGGSVEYRLGNGEWMNAWGFERWSFLVDERSLPPTGLYVFVRANDGKDYSAVEFTKIVPSYTAPDQPTVNEPVDEGNEPGSGESSYSHPIPADPGNGGPSWLIAGGMGAIIIGGLLFILWTEVGYVTITTSLITLYSKLSKKDILNHEIRGLIRGYIIANPGDHYSSIKRNLDLNNGTLAYHLRVLEQNGFVKSMYDGIYKRYYPANINISRLKKNISKQEEIFNMILEHPGITMEQIGRLIGASRQVVNYHVKNLIRAGVVTYSRDGKSARFYPAEQTPSMDQT